MRPSIQDILAPLAPHWDRIVRRPMSGKEIDDLGRLVGLPVPQPLREFLEEVGLFQDLTWWQASAIELYDAPTQFVSAREFLSRILPPKAADLFPFGGDGAGNIFCLPSADGVPCRIHFVDHETGKVSKKKDFTDWLEAVVAKVLRGIRRRPKNDCKAWSVQFAFRQTSYSDLVELLRSIGKVKSLDADWMNRDTSPEGVTSTERQIEFNGQRLKIGQLECADWKAPILSFNMREPLHPGLARSQIRQLDALFRAKCPGYKLVDYGPLDISKMKAD